MTGQSRMSNRPKQEMLDVKFTIQDAYQQDTNTAKLPWCADEPIPTRHAQRCEGCSVWDHHLLSFHVEQSMVVEYQCS